MTERISTSHALLTLTGIICVAIDEVEAPNLWLLLQSLFGKENEIGVAAVCTNISGVTTPKKLAAAHEYAIFFGKIKDVKVGHLKWTEEQLRNYNLTDDAGSRFRWVNFRNDAGGPNKFRENSPRLFYPIFVQGEAVRIPNMEWNEETRQWQLMESSRPDEVTVFPIQTNGSEVTWSSSVERAKEILASSGLYPRIDRNGNMQIRLRWYLNEEGILPKTWWAKREYAAGSYGTTVLKNMLGDNLAFPYPKSIHLVEDCLRVSSLRKGDTVLDYFGGSGTTANATINLNRQDDGRRKYILVEMGHHFDSVLKPRVLKAVYAERWREAKPVDRDSRLSQIIKYQRIESYEDALNNVEFNDTEPSELLPDEHRLSYRLQRETSESQTFLNVAELRNPFEYRLKIAKDMQVKAESVDLPETFNYLLGLHVQSRTCYHDGDRRYLVYRGSVAQKRVAIIWRETAGWTGSDYEQDYRFIEAQNLTENADTVYVNTDSIVPNAHPIDPIFKKLMFT